MDEFYEPLTIRNIQSIRGYISQFTDNEIKTEKSISLILNVDISKNVPKRGFSMLYIHFLGDIR